MQMYKVFLKSKTIILTDKVFFLANPSEDTMILFEPDIKKLQDIFSRLESNQRYNKLIIFSLKLEEYFSRFYGSMKIITAAGGIVLNPQSEVLLIFRRNVWDLPKGKIDHGESDEKAAIREVQEETGLVSLTIEKRINPTFHLYQISDEWILKETHWFLMKNPGDEATEPQALENITSVEWRSIPSLNSIVDNTYLSVWNLLCENFDLTQCKDKQ